jgi:hypothetical protein
LKLTTAVLVAETVAMPATLAAAAHSEVMTIEIAQAVAQEAMMKCRAGGHRVTVTVVDHARAESRDC